MMKSKHKLKSSSELDIPFSGQELKQIYCQKALFEQKNNIKFIDLSDFISHLVSEGLNQFYIEGK